MASAVNSGPLRQRLANQAMSGVALAADAPGRYLALLYLCLTCAEL